MNKSVRILKTRNSPRAGTSNFNLPKVILSHLSSQLLALCRLFSSDTTISHLAIPNNSYLIQSREHQTAMASNFHYGASTASHACAMMTNVPYNASPIPPISSMVANAPHGTSTTPCVSSLMPNALYGVPAARAASSTISNASYDIQMASPTGSQTRDMSTGQYSSSMANRSYGMSAVPALACAPHDMSTGQPSSSMAVSAAQQMARVAHATNLRPNLPNGSSTNSFTYPSPTHLTINGSTMPHVHPAVRTFDEMNRGSLNCPNANAKSNSSPNKRLKLEIPLSPAPLPPVSPNHKKIALQSSLPSSKAKNEPLVYAITFRNGTKDRNFHFTIKNALKAPWRHLFDGREVELDLGPGEKSVYRVELPSSVPSYNCEFN